MNDPLVNQPTSQPTNKVKAGLSAGVVVTLIIGLLAQFGIIIPEEVGTAVVVTIGGVVTIVSFVSSYLAKNKKSQG
jgi:hypothetical protein